MEYIQDLQRQINNFIIPLISNEQLLYYINNIKQIFQDLDKNYIFNVKKIENVQTNDKIKNQIKFSSNDDDDNNNNDDNNNTNNNCYLASYAYMITNIILVA